MSLLLAPNVADVPALGVVMLPFRNSLAGKHVSFGEKLRAQDKLEVRSPDLEADMEVVFFKPNLGDAFDVKNSVEIVAVSHTAPPVSNWAERTDARSPKLNKLLLTFAPAPVGAKASGAAVSPLATLTSAATVVAHTAAAFSDPNGP